jgi:RNA polymerase sigma-70 factor (ECF subfamily)
MTSITVGPDPGQLLQLAQTGSGPALGELLDLYRGYLAILARVQIGLRLQGKVDPSDLVQDTFLQAHHGFGQFRGTTKKELVSWLRQIMASNLANLMRHYYGTQRRDVRLERELDDDLERSSRALNRGFVARQNSPSQSAARREQAVLLPQALDRLPAHYREVLILHHLEGVSFPDVARRMERTEDSVEKLWARALAQLRRSLAVLGAENSGA